MILGLGTIYVHNGRGAFVTGPVKSLHDFGTDSVTSTANRQILKKLPESVEET
jgi:hypothetical protein